MNNDGNGHEDTETLERIVPAIEGTSIEQAYSTPEHTDNTRLLITPGDTKEWAELLMRSAIPSRRFLLGLAVSLAKCRKHEYKPGMEVLRTFLAGFPSVGDKRAELFSDTIIGERSSKLLSNKVGLLGRAKNWFNGVGGETP